MRVRRLIAIAGAFIFVLAGTLAGAEAASLVGGWVGQGADPNSGTVMRVQYSIMPNGTFQKSFAMQAGLSGGYDWIAGIWFTEGQWLRFEVRQHYSSSSGSNGPLPPGELWLVEMPNQNTLLLTHALCVQQHLNRPGLPAAPDAGAVGPPVARSARG